MVAHLPATDMDHQLLNLICSSMRSNSVDPSFVIMQDYVVPIEQNFDPVIFKVALLMTELRMRLINTKYLCSKHFQDRSCDVIVAMVTMKSVTWVYALGE